MAHVFRFLSQSNTGIISCQSKPSALGSEEWRYHGPKTPVAASAGACEALFFGAAATGW
jgi:hypothetical protein